MNGQVILFQHPGFPERGHGQEMDLQFRNAGQRIGQVIIPGGRQVRTVIPEPDPVPEGINREGSH